MDLARRTCSFLFNQSGCLCYNLICQVYCYVKTHILLTPPPLLPQIRLCELCEMAQQQQQSPPQSSMSSLEALIQAAQYLEDSESKPESCIVVILFMRDVHELEPCFCVANMLCSKR